MSRLILVIDDEREIRDAIEAALNKQGHQVVTADRGETAIQLFCSMFPRPDLVLVDVVMPGMSGPMVVERLRELDEHVRILFMSGFHERLVVQRFVLEEGFQIMMKPFTLNELRDSVKQALESYPPAREQENLIH